MRDEQPQFALLRVSAIHTSIVSIAFQGTELLPARPQINLD